MQTAKLAAESNQVESMKIYKRIGSSVYEVHVYFNQDAKETMDSKIFRLIKNEAYTYQGGKRGKVAG